MACPLLCAKCRHPAGVAEDYIGHADWGLAVVGDDGVVRPMRQHVDIFRGDSFRVRAVCSNDDCGHQWTLRRKFDPIPMEENL